MGTLKDQVSELKVKVDTCSALILLSNDSCRLKRYELSEIFDY